MLVQIGKEFINPDQITHMTQNVLDPEEGKTGGRKAINIHLSSRRCLYYIAGQEGYAAACVLRDRMLGKGNSDWSGEWFTD